MKKHSSFCSFIFGNTFAIPANSGIYSKTLPKMQTSLQLSFSGSANISTYYFLINPLLNFHLFS